MEPNRNPQISSATLWLMIPVSIFFDVLEAIADLIMLIPIIGTGVGLMLEFLINVLASLTFYVWFKTKGVTFSSTKRAMSFWLGIALGFIPFTSWFAWTVSVIMTVRSVNHVRTNLQNIAARVPGSKIGGSNLSGPRPQTTQSRVRPDLNRSVSTEDVRGGSNNIVRPNFNNRPQSMNDIRAPRED